MRAPAPLNPAKNLRVAAIASGFAIAMLGLAYASVPLYKLFCQATGFGGTTQRADSAPALATATDISIRLDANIDAGLGWNFKPKDQRLTVKIGEPTLAYFLARNTTNTSLTGKAMFNVSPAEAGIFFNKLECFCFTEQTLKAGESVEMPVQFFVDPAILDDPDTRNIHEITLSYTFYSVTAAATAATTN